MRKQKYLEPIYDDYIEESEEVDVYSIHGESLVPICDEYIEPSKEVDVYPIQGEELVLPQTMKTCKSEEGDWRHCSIFHTRVLCGNKVCDLVINGGSMENIISNDAMEELKSKVLRPLREKIWENIHSPPECKIKGFLSAENF